jgi:5-methylthioadenosine/S-adenosylhomocysteine deaminase
MAAHADTLLHARWVVPIEPVGRVIHDGAVVIAQDKIAAVGPAQDLMAQYPEAKIQHLPNHVLMPGLVNTHTHAAMALLKGVGDDLPLQQWLTQRIWPLEGKLMSHDFVHDGTLLAASEMLLGGITCFNDMYFFPEATVRAARALGMRVAVGIIVIDFPSPYGSGPDEYLAKGLALRDELLGDRLTSFTLAPHAPYTVSDQVFGKVAGLAGELGLPIHCHIHETAQEVEDSLRTHGMRPLERLNKLGIVHADLIAVHAVHLNEDDIGLLARARASVAHCPHSNLKLASGVAPSAAMHRAGINLTIGTDGSASNNRLDLWGEARTAALLAKGGAGAFTPADAALLPAATILECMTLGGAKALGLDGQIGSLVPGKQADLIAVAFDDAATQPVFDPISHLVYCASPTQVQEVWIGGQHVVNKRQHNAQAHAALHLLWESGTSVWHNRVAEVLSGITP